MQIYLLFFFSKITLILLAGNEGPDQRVSRLRVQTEGVSQRLELWTLFQESLLESVAAGVEVLLDGVQSRVQYRALLRR